MNHTVNFVLVDTPELPAHLVRDTPDLMGLSKNEFERICANGGDTILPETLFILSEGEIPKNVSSETAQYALEQAISLVQNFKSFLEMRVDNLASGLDHLESLKENS